MKSKLILLASAAAMLATPALAAEKIKIGFSVFKGSFT